MITHGNDDMQIDDKPLNDYEVSLVRKHRAEVKAKEDAFQMRLLVLSTALGFEQWLKKNSEGYSYSGFVNQFSYQGRDSRNVYEKVCRVLDSIDN
jgi:hypothetical protein